MPKNQYKTAVLVDLEYLRRTWQKIKRNHPCNDDFMQVVRSCIAPDEALFRAFFYDCYPCERKLRNPFTGEEISCHEGEFIAKRTEQLKELAQMDYVAFRAGELKTGGWILSRYAINDLSKKRKTLADITPDDFIPELNQKRVDIKIGLDVAWLSSRQIVDKIILITGDTDFIPAMKHARREGVQIIIARIGEEKIHAGLKEHSDECRNIPV